jgi:hypothetical protein
MLWESVILHQNIDPCLTMKTACCLFFKGLQIFSCRRKILFNLKRQWNKEAVKSLPKAPCTFVNKSQNRPILQRVLNDNSGDVHVPRLSAGRAHSPQYRCPSLPPLQYASVSTARRFPGEKDLVWFGRVCLPRSALMPQNGLCWFFNLSTRKEVPVVKSVLSHWLIIFFSKVGPSPYWGRSW